MRNKKGSGAIRGNLNYLALALTLLLAVTGLLGGCGKAAQASIEPEDEDVLVMAEEADPETALERIYENVDIQGIETGDDTILSDKFYIDMGKIEDYYVRYSSGRFGVADVFILKPVPDEAMAVRELLEQVKISRTQEFQNYDIYNSYQIAQDAQIFEQGEYLVMLMLEDNDTAREIIDQYIPRK